MSSHEFRPPAPAFRHLCVLIGVGLLLAVTTALALSTSALSSGGGEPVAAPIPLAAHVAPAQAAIPEPAPPEPPQTVVTRGELGSGDTLAASFARAGVARGVAFRIARDMSEAFSFRKQARPGHSWQLTQAADQRVLDFRYRVSPTDTYHLLFEDGRPVVRREDARLVPHVARIAGVVASSLYDAVEALGEDPQLARDFADIFAWDLDFSRSVRTGDEFQIVYERLHRVEDDGTELYLRPGLIHAARYSGASGEHFAIYFETEEGRGGYYRPDGTSVQGQYLKAPLRYARISSSYSAARLHPILKVKRPHHGIDYAAPLGEPVWAVADGKVVYQGWAGGFGNLVKIRHRDGYISYYAHLSRFAAGLGVGSGVRQKQVIGYVGQTGLATGPHVCFRIAKDGGFVNPTTLRTPAGPPVPDATRDLFESTRDLLLAEMGAGPVLAQHQTP
jgi:murein DD-endopeptidase MepM/ murein hydrolase activator NlpD